MAAERQEGETEVGLYRESSKQGEEFERRDLEALAGFDVKRAPRAITTLRAIPVQCSRSAAPLRIFFPVPDPQQGAGVQPSVAQK